MAKIRASFFLWNTYLAAFLICFIPRTLVAFLANEIGAYALPFNNLPPNNYLIYPGYAVLIHILKELSYGSLTLYTLYHLTLHGMIGPITLALCRLLNIDKAGTLLSILGVALLPYYLSLSGFQPQTGLVVSLCGLFVYTYFSWAQIQYPKKKAAILCLVLFIILFFRPEVIIVFGALYSYTLFTNKANKRTLPSLLTPAFLLLLITAVAITINYWFAGEARLPLPKHSGKLLYQGNNPHVHSYVSAYTQSLYIESYYVDHPLPDTIAQAITPEERDNLLKKKAITFIKENPMYFIKITALKFLRYWDFRLDDAAVETREKNAAYSIPYLLYAPLALFGFHLLYKKRHPFAVPLIGIMLVHALFLSVIITSIRYRMVFEFVLIIAASHAVSSIIKKDTHETP